MIYSREYLIFTKKTLEETQNVVQTLVNAAARYETLTLSEAKFIGGFLANANSEDPAGSKLLQQISDSLPGYHFWTLFLKYISDVNGEGIVYDSKGPISTEQKIKDVAFLENVFHSWSEVIKKTNHKHTMLQYLSKESRDDIKETLEYAKKQGDGSRRRDIIYKSLILHSRFVYSKIEEYYQEYEIKKDILQLCNWEIVIDSFVYAHVAIRHMAPWTKFGRPGKSFIKDPAISIDELPRFIKNILIDYGASFNCQQFNSRKIYFKFNGTNYVIWFERYTRNIKGGGLKEFLRVETFYPVEIKKNAIAVEKLTLAKVSENLGFYL
jgi:hypothetical protein